MTVKLNQPVRHPHTGEITTIAQMAERGMILFLEVSGFQRRGGNVGTAYFADLISDPGSGWEIGKLAYESRSGVPAALFKPKAQVAP